MKKYFILLLISFVSSICYPFGYQAHKRKYFTAFTPTDISGLTLWTKADDSGGRHYITANGAIVTTAVSDKDENDNGVMYLDGTDYPEIAQSTDFDFEDNNFSISFDVKFNSPIANWQCIIGKAEGTSIEFLLEYNHSGNKWAFIFYNSSTSFSADFAWTATADTWYSCKLERIGSDLKLYIDDVQTGSTYNIGAETLKTVSEKTYIGRQGGYSDYLNGYLSNFVIVNAGTTVFSAPMTGQNNSTIFADNAIPADTDTVASWNDRSGNYNHVVQSTSGNRPTLQKNALNTKPVIRFSSQYLNSTLELTQAQSIFAVAKTTDTDGWHGMISTKGFVVYSNLNLANWGVFGSNINQSAGQNLSAYKVISIIANNYDDIDLYTNGENKVTATTGSAWGTFGTEIGASGGGSEFFNGDIAEILIYDNAISDTDRQKVENYLTNKWITQ